MTTTKKGQMLHKKSNVFGRVPSASTLGFGEIAVNYNEKEPFLAIKTSGETNNFEVVKISSDKIIEQKINDAVDKVGSELNELADIVSQNELVTADSLTELNDTINYVDSKFSDYATSADTSSTIKAVSAATSAAIKAVNDKADALSDTVNDAVSSLTETINNKVSSAYIYKGSKKTFNELPTEGNNKGDVWNVEGAHDNIPAGTNYAWDGTQWDALAGIVDLTIYATSAATSAAIKVVNDKADALSNKLTKDYATSASIVSTITELQDKLNDTSKEKVFIMPEDFFGEMYDGPDENGFVGKIKQEYVTDILENKYTKMLEITDGYQQFGEFDYFDEYNLKVKIRRIEDFSQELIAEQIQILEINVNRDSVDFCKIKVQAFTSYFPFVYSMFDDGPQNSYGLKRLTFIDSILTDGGVSLPEENKQFFKKNMGSFADWNAQKGEAGYIENRTHYTEKVNGELFQVTDDIYDIHYKINQSDNELIDDVFYLRVFYAIDDTNILLNKVYKSSNFHNELYNGLELGTIDTPLGILDIQVYEDGCLYTILVTSADGGYFDKEGIINEFVVEKIYVLDEKYLPDTVLKTTPQTLSDTDKNQALANLGLTDIAKKSELDKIYSSAVTNTNVQISEFYFYRVFNLKYEQSDNTVYYKGTYGENEWAVLPFWLLNRHLAYALGGDETITTNMIITSGSSFLQVINDFKIYADETTNYRAALSWNYDGKKYILTFNIDNGTQNIVVEQSLEAIVEENEEIVSSALNSLNDDIKQLHKIIEEGDGGVSNSVAIEAVSQVATDLYNFKNEVRTGITVYNSERIAGQTIDEIVAQIGGGSNGGGINPEYDSVSRAYVVGVDDDGNAYYSDVYMSGNTLNAPNGFFQQSDENLKTFISNVEVDLEKITQLPKKYFMWSDKRDENIHIGTSAQAVQELYPEIVKRDKNGNLTVDYSKLSVIALKAIDVLNEERKQMKADIAEIKTKLGL